jgi:hypothetical protein
VIATVTVTLALTLANGTAQAAPTPAPVPVPSAAAPAPAPVSSGTPEPLPIASAVPSPGATVEPAPSVAPAATASATPQAYKYRFVPRQPAVHQPGTPQIFAIFLNDNTLRGGGRIAIKVVTSPDVVKVITRSNGREGAIPETAPGDFETGSRLPKIPFIAAGITTFLEFVAFTADGKSVSVRVPVKLG